MSHYIGERLSFRGDRCTVRYIGTLGDQPRDWLGVEWDDPAKGKHDGTYDGVRYFSWDFVTYLESKGSCLTGRSASKTAGSFIRPARRCDPPLSFLEALEKKYVSASDAIGPQSEEINIGGKTVVEVGFEKIQRRLAAMSELSIVILDELCVKGVSNMPCSPENMHAMNEQRNWLQSLKMHELDLSRNLLESWADVLFINNSLPRLRTLRLTGNRFHDLSIPADASKPRDFTQLRELALEDTLLDWETIATLTSHLPALSALTVSYNRIRTLSTPLQNSDLVRLDLSFNEISSVRDIWPLSSMLKLSDLSLRSNPITTLASEKVELFSLRHLDLTATRLPNFASLNPIPNLSPSLRSLLTKDTPLSKNPSASLLTIARIATLTELNYSHISSAERMNAELYYLSTITKVLSDAASPVEEKQILACHPRWPDLCRIYGEPEIPRKPQESVFKPGALGARVANFVFLMPEQSPFQAHDVTQPSPPKDTSEEARSHTDVMGLEPHDTATPKPTININEMSASTPKSRLLPLTTSTYRLIGIAASLFSLRPISTRLILETDEFDPVGDKDGGWSVSEDDSIEGEGEATDGRKSRGGKQEKGQWVRREEELVGSTRSVGDWLPLGFGGKEADLRVRVELRKGELDGTSLSSTPS
ncbi:MAG: hypothetical protein Q9163_000909 [Psora crenata]